MMSHRIVAMRAALVWALKKTECPTPNHIYADWSHITLRFGILKMERLARKSDYPGTRCPVTKLAPSANPPP